MAAAAAVLLRPVLVAARAACPPSGLASDLTVNSHTACPCGSSTCAGGGDQVSLSVWARRCRADVYRARARRATLGGARYYVLSFAGSGFHYRQLRHMAAASAEATELLAA